MIRNQPYGICLAYLVLRYARTALPTITEWQERLLVLTMLRSDGVILYPRRAGKKTLHQLVQDWEKQS